MNFTHIDPTKPNLNHLNIAKYELENHICLFQYHIHSMVILKILTVEFASLVLNTLSLTLGLTHPENMQTFHEIFARVFPMNYSSIKLEHFTSFVTVVF